MRTKAKELHDLVEGIMHRRELSVLKDSLPELKEYVLFVGLTPLQEKLYVEYLKRIREPGRSTSLFARYQEARKIWTHLAVMKLSSEINKGKGIKELQASGECSGVELLLKINEIQNRRDWWSEIVDQMDSSSESKVRENRFFTQI